MKIKEKKCKLCMKEKTTFGFIYYEKIIPICPKCISFIKNLKQKEINNDKKR